MRFGGGLTGRSGKREQGWWRGDGGREGGRRRGNGKEKAGETWERRTERRETKLKGEIRKKIQVGLEVEIGRGSSCREEIRDHRRGTRQTMVN